MDTITGKDYTRPLAEYGEYFPAIICDSLVEGGSEDLTEENWDF